MSLLREYEIIKSNFNPFLKGIKCVLLRAEQIHHKWFFFLNIQFIRNGRQTYNHQLSSFPVCWSVFKEGKDVAEQQSLLWPTAHIAEHTSMYA